MGLNGVVAVIRCQPPHGLELPAGPRETKVAAIGPATAGALEAVGLSVDVVPEEFRAEALIEAIKDGSLAGKRVLIPRAKVAREVLPERLREAGAEVVVPPAYETVPSSEGKEALARELAAGSIDCVTFTASSTVENFVGAFGAEESARLLGGARVVCIGPITADTARGFGLGVDAEAREYTIPGLVEAVVDLLATDPAQR